MTNITALSQNVILAANAHFQETLASGVFGTSDADVVRALSDGREHAAASLVRAIAEWRAAEGSATTLERNVLLSANASFECFLGDGPYAFTDNALVHRNCNGHNNSIAQLTFAIAAWRAAIGLGRVP